MTPLMNNPLFFMLQAMRRGGNPQQLVQQIAGSDPRMKQITQLLGNRSPGQQRQFVLNMAKERGVDIDNLARSLGIQIPSER